MKVWVLADDEQKEELLSFPVDDIIELEWVTDVSVHSKKQHADACIDLLFENNPDRVEWLKSLPVSLVVINSVIDTLGDIHQEFVRINGWNTFLKRPVVEAACDDATLRNKTEKLLVHFGRRVEWVPDIAGFITPRVVASIINEAFFALEEKVSTPEEIDTAMRLGTNYPFGPFEWGKKIGLQKVYSLLASLSRVQNRYQPSLLLKQTALA